MPLGATVDSQWCMQTHAAYGEAVVRKNGLRDWNRLTDTQETFHAATRFQLYWWWSPPRIGRDSIILVNTIHRQAAPPSPCDCRFLISWFAPLSGPVRNRSLPNSPLQLATPRSRNFQCGDCRTRAFRWPETGFESSKPTSADSPEQCSQCLLGTARRARVSGQRTRSLVWTSVLYPFATSDFKS